MDFSKLVGTRALRGKWGGRCPARPNQLQLGDVIAHASVARFVANSNRYDRAADAEAARSLDRGLHDVAVARCVTPILFTRPYGRLMSC